MTHAILDLLRRFVAQKLFAHQPNLQKSIVKPFGNRKKNTSITNSFRNLNLFTSIWKLEPSVSMHSVNESFLQFNKLLIGRDSIAITFKCVECKKRFFYVLRLDFSGQKTRSCGAELRLALNQVTEGVQRGDVEFIIAAGVVDCLICEVSRNLTSRRKSKQRRLSWILIV